MIRRLFLLYTVILALLLVSCGSAVSAPSDGADADGDSSPDGMQSTLPPSLSGIPLPDSYKRPSVHFEDIVYLRPDVDALLLTVRSAEDAIKNNTEPYESQIEMIYTVDSEYVDYLAMETYLTIATSRDKTDTYYAEEYAFVTEAYASIADAIDDLCVAAASSEHAELFERDYFGDGFTEEYADGEKISERAAELFAEETRLENEYRALSPATVIITYGGITSSYESALMRIESVYKNDSPEKRRAISECEVLYNQSKAASVKTLFAELVRTRSLISDELGYDSYTDYAYETIYHDYTPEQMEQFCQNVKNYIVPVYSSLGDKVFYNYFTKNAAPSTDVSSVISTLDALYRGTDAEIAGIFGYMKHYGMYDMSLESLNRSGGAYTTYFKLYQSPYIFMSADGTARDFAVMSHEFGHFVDSFINYGSKTSLDLHEVSSQALELLTLESLDGVIPSSQRKYLHYSEMENALLIMIYQAFYSSFEHLVYALDYDEITEEKLGELVSQAATELSLSSEYYNDLSYVLMDHTVLYPHYVQSYAVSIVPSLEIYFLECETEGAGYEAYKSLITREDDSDMISQLKSAKLSDPFDGELLKSIADKIYFSILGCHYYTEFSYGDRRPNAA